MTELTMETEPFHPRPKLTKYDIPQDLKVNYCTKTLTEGTELRGPESLPLPCDILHEHDCCVTLRDGTKIYTDVYRPTTAKEGTVPAVICAGPYGKEGSRFFHEFTDHAQWRFGIPMKMVSGLEKFLRDWIRRIGFFTDMLLCILVSERMRECGLRWDLLTFGLLVHRSRGYWYLSRRYACLRSARG